MDASPAAALDRRARNALCTAVVAREVCRRVAEGQTLKEVCADPHLPSLRTVVRWREDHPEFAEDLRQAREGLAERLSDLGWKMAMEATPETAYLTRVRLGQLRWTAAVMGPRTHGRLKPAEAPQPPEVQTYCFRHFKIEENTVTGQHRVVGYTPDPDHAAGAHQRGAVEGPDRPRGQGRGRAAAVRGDPPFAGRAATGRSGGVVLRG
ncbi:hypothetical protein [Phenylobacterium sp.]|uniref:terminase small subunit-like protein n=1 Tax=Phenylobacterium sp. TaxID=1871053 RepID=UPI001200BFA9|nr:hypothetical protein [Phenylobacterium sp.]THD58411.1 MAG: hypothetical protein E8A49_19580 [Phenylobacterium sp.]